MATIEVRENAAETLEAGEPKMIRIPNTLHSWPRPTIVSPFYQEVFEDLKDWVKKYSDSLGNYEQADLAKSQFGGTILLYAFVNSF
jgi:hypothetical protein